MESRSPSRHWPRTERIPRQPPNCRVVLPSHLHISPFFVENKRPPSNRPIPPFYNRTGMKLSSPRPPPRANQEIPNEAIFPPTSYQTQPLTPSRHEPDPNPPAARQTAPFTFLYNESCQ